MTIKRRLKGSKSGGSVQTDNGGKRFEEAVTCPDETAVTGSKAAQQTRKGCAASRWVRD
ncbi:MAG: hypothetical protein ACLR23_21885 [Clostridia bacterium]